MPIQVSLADLLEYTDWERQKWFDWLRKHGDAVLQTSAGPFGDGRFASVGELIRHIFSAEKRYVERLSERPLTDTASISNQSIDALFEFGRQSRKELKEFLESFPADEWDRMHEYSLMNSVLKATPRKIIVHVVTHEIRHWAQIGTLLRLNGLTGELHDFLFSPVMGGEFKHEEAKG